MPRQITYHNQAPYSVLMADVVPISGTHPTNVNATPQRAVKKCLKHDENNHGIALTMPF